MPRKADLTRFDPNGPGQDNGNLFGLPHTPEEAAVVAIPVPWDTTTSYQPGTSQGPVSILQASLQVDLFDEISPQGWKKGIAMLDIPESLQQKNSKLRKKAEALISRQEMGTPVYELREQLDCVNRGCEDMNEWVETNARQILQHQQIPCVLGGDHSSPLGLIRALSNSCKAFGILQIDAHLDLRKAYEGFTYSHASIMFNALQLDGVTRLVQVGIRDYCEEEVDYANQEGDRVSFFTFRQMETGRFAGKSRARQFSNMIDLLPKQVYISFDIDGLDPALCPHTGTPVPGGLQFEEATYLVDHVIASGRQIIGFDLCEVAPGKDEWDANVGARVLYRLFQAAIRSQSTNA